MRKSKFELNSFSSGRKSSDFTSYNNNISDDTTILSMVSKLDNNLNSKNIFKIYKTEPHNYQSIKIRDKHPIKIYIKNENNITNYNCGREFSEPVIMNHSTTSRHRKNYNSCQALNERRTTHNNKTSNTSQNYCGFLQKKFDSDIKLNLPGSKINEPILQRRKQSQKLDNNFFLEESLVEMESNYFPRKEPKVIPRMNKLVQTESKQYSLERKNNSTLNLPKITETLKNQESSNFSLFKSMNSNELGNYIDNLIQQFRIKANLCEASVVENTQFNNVIFYPENKEDSFVDKKEEDVLKEAKDEKSIEEVSKLVKNDNTSMDKSSFRTESLTNLIESKAFDEDQDVQDEDLNESTTFINYTHSFEIDEEETLGDEPTYPSISE